MYVLQVLIGSLDCLCLLRLTRVIALASFGFTTQAKIALKVLLTVIPLGREISDVTFIFDFSIEYISTCDINCNCVKSGTVVLYNQGWRSVFSIRELLKASARRSLGTPRQNFEI